MDEINVFSSDSPRKGAGLWEKKATGYLSSDPWFTEYLENNPLPSYDEQMHDAISFKWICDLIDSKVFPEDFVTMTETQLTLVKLLSEVCIADRDLILTAVSKLENFDLDATKRLIKALDKYIYEHINDIDSGTMLLYTEAPKEYYYLYSEGLTIPITSEEIDFNRLKDRTVVKYLRKLTQENSKNAIKIAKVLLSHNSVYPDEIIRIISQHPDAQDPFVYLVKDYFIMQAGRTSIGAQNLIKSYNWDKVKCVVISTDFMGSIPIIPSEFYLQKGNAVYKKLLPIVNRYSFICYSSKNTRNSEIIYINWFKTFDDPNAYKLSKSYEGLTVNIYTELLERYKNETSSYIIEKIRDIAPLEINKIKYKQWGKVIDILSPPMLGLIQQRDYANKDLVVVLSEIISNKIAQLPKLDPSKVYNTTIVWADDSAYDLFDLFRNLDRLYDNLNILKTKTKVEYTQDKDIIKIIFR